MAHHHHHHADVGDDGGIPAMQPMFTRLYVDAPAAAKRLFEDELEAPPVPTAPAARPVPVPATPPMGPAQHGGAVVHVGPHSSMRGGDGGAFGHVVLLCDPAAEVPTPPSAKVLVIRVPDDRREVVLHRFDQVVHFIEGALQAQSAILVCSMHGVSRAPCFFIAFLMKSCKCGFGEAMTVVKQHCEVFINPGFERQLHIFADVGCDLQGTSLLHKHVRLYCLSSLQRSTATYTQEARALCFQPVVGQPDGVFVCKSCNQLLFEPKYSAMKTKTCTRTNLTPSPKDTRDSAACTCVHTEVPEWMVAQCWCVERGVVACPRCGSQVGAFNWQGKSCTCRYLVRPGFQFFKTALLLLTHKP
eukprot:TRINITY_DN3911_c0_g2_i1.p1 TRINITY_DN3911_c0_g2~~TRINITY_DN3911_c0_g2_i1.p1  ORF type:complete len:358 (+),score=66.46 TRINITY_DN3911_c0_g2_i1:51-1124(+)